MKVALTALTALILAYLGFGALLFFTQRSLIYFPQPTSENPLDNLTIDSDQQRINISRLNPGRDKAIIYFGGNSENVNYNAELFGELFGDHTVYLFHYRGYGTSTGTPTEQGIYADSLALYDTISEQYTLVSTIGRSLGSGVASYLAAHRPVNELVLITPYDSLQSVAQSRYPIYPIGLLLHDKFDSLSRIDKIDATVLILAAEHDDVIPRPHTERLFRAFPKAPAFYTIAGSHHGDISSFPEYRERLGAFFER